MEKAAIYHFTDKSTHRPKIYRDQLNSLKEFAVSAGFEVVDVYCDMSLKRCERTEFDRFLSCCGQYDALITKDFYHISENTGMCMSILKDLRNKGLKIFTPVNGSFLWEDSPLEKPLRVATYTSHYGTLNEMKEVIPVKNDILKLFIDKKTAWTLTDQYYDQSLRQKDGEQVQLTKLLNNNAIYYFGEFQNHQLIIRHLFDRSDKFPPLIFPHTTCLYPRVNWRQYAEFPCSSSHKMKLRGKFLLRTGIVVKQILQRPFYMDMECRYSARCAAYNISLSQITTAPPLSLRIA